MIDRVKVQYGQYDSYFVYYEFDRQGRIISMENTHDGVKDIFTYGVNEYGDDIALVTNNLGEDRDIVFDHSGYANGEYSYYRDQLTQKIEYVYNYNDMLRDAEITTFDEGGNEFSTESYDLYYDKYNAITNIDTYYQEQGYYERSKLSFDAMSSCENIYNVDLLAIMGLYVNYNYASLIGRAGERSTYLPARTTLSVTRNGKRDNDITCNIKYYTEKGLITKIELFSSKNVDQVFYISYQ